MDAQVLHLERDLVDREVRDVEEDVRVAAGGLAAAALARLPLTAGGLATVETSRQEEVEAEGFEVETVRTYGKAKVALLRKL